MFVAFEDIGDLTNVKQVEPGNLSATFGSGVRLKTITVEVADDRVTSRIEQRLKWLGSHWGTSVD